MHKKYDVITILDTCVDLIAFLGNTIPEFDQKEKYIDSFSLELGGSNCIFASQCAKLNLSVAGAGVVGDDIFGRMVIEKLNEAGVNISHIAVNPAVKTGLGILLVKEKTRSILTYAGSIKEAGPDCLNEDFLSRGRHLHIGSYYLLSKIQNRLPEILRNAKKSGLTISLDTNWDPDETWLLPDDMLNTIDVFMPNEKEILFLSGKKDVWEAAEYFSKKIPLVTVKMGAAGGLTIHKGERYMLPAVEAPVIDAVGAGDSFDAGYLYAFLHGMSARDCLRSGLFCGSMNTSKPGGTAGQAGLSELKNYLRG
jgi:sugar/nucleoside kinase (ribokinase family)